MSNQAAYLHHFKSLLPTGPAFAQQKDTALEAILSVFAAEFNKIDARSQILIQESDPRTTLEMLEDWERAAGLPDPCVGADATFQERRDSLVQRITSRGGQSKDFFISVAEKMGYEISIQEHRPFICSKSRCGTAETGTVTDDEIIRFHWTINITNARLTNFRTGVSRCGESLGKFSRAEDLECIFSRIKPAHTVMHFNYEGV